ncbi:MAG: mu-protocadherin- cell-suface protein, partial [Planctomycetota bacterium]
IGGAEVATAEEFAQSAMDLATVEPPASEEEASEAEWLPLGTFAVSTDERDTDPTITVQLAVDKQGVVAGTLYNIETDEAQAIQGAVDRETQRVAVRFGENESLVAETGLYNLTQDEAPVLVHFGPDTTENYLLVRLDAPEEATDEGAN